MKKEKLFVFNIVTAFGNKGDLLINRALIENLRDFGKVVVVTGHLPPNFLFDLELSEEEKCLTFGKCILRNMFRYTVYKVGIPGHSLDDEPRYFSGMKELLVTAVFKYIFRFKFLRVGTSLGPIHKFKLNIERIKAKMYVLYGLRDNASVKMCSPSKMLYFPDLAFISPDIASDIPKITDKNYCLLSFRAKFPDAEMSETYLSQVIVRLEEFLEKEGIKSIVIAYQVVEDKKTSMEIYSALNKSKKFNIDFIDELLELKDSMRLISEASLVLSNRLHVLLPSLIAGVPHIALTDVALHQKISALYDTVGAKFVLHDINNPAEIVVAKENSPENLKLISKNQQELALDILKSKIN
ncbi:polysaccharide pyruvyl transferase family protein [Paraglaciecola arctica]|uniref:polysaccharide pyruvyl transferase family protein n=1 Tax=Paraglaciecola arctica TaxID=1128911 RepID=UPI001C06BAB4|nr:polysaccharide pyruvyl transferase family protein [Paraglaciecola arctica]MBU3005727.1 polysaccharide pyruvyl transferase family protein [Paraglaciecola arctica]